MSQALKASEKPTLLIKDKTTNPPFMGLTPTRVKGAPGRVPLHPTSNDMMISPARPSRQNQADSIFASPLAVAKKSRKSSIDQRPAWSNEFVVTEKKVTTRQGLTPRKVPLNNRANADNKTATSPSTPFPSKTTSKPVNQLRGASKLSSDNSFSKKLQASRDEPSDETTVDWRQRCLQEREKAESLEKQLAEARNRIQELEAKIATEDKENNTEYDSVDVNLSEAFKKSVTFQS